MFEKISVLFTGEYTLYWSFDTLDNLTKMTGQQESNFSAIVEGQVQLYCQFVGYKQ